MIKEHAEAVGAKQTWQRAEHEAARTAALAAAAAVAADAKKRALHYRATAQQAKRAWAKRWMEKVKLAGMAQHSQVDPAV